MGVRRFKVGEGKSRLAQGLPRMMAGRYMMAAERSSVGVVSYRVGAGGGILNMHHPLKFKKDDLNLKRVLSLISFGYYIRVLLLVVLVVVLLLLLVGLVPLKI